jgi:putative membrane protein
MNSFSIAALAAATALSGCAMTDRMGASPMAAAGMAMPTSASAYMQMAHSSDMFEVESSRMALQMSRSQPVRQFAQMMINEHTMMMNEMMRMAPAMGMQMHSMAMMPHHMAMMQRLRAAGSNFDAMYKRAQMMAHQEAVMMHRTYAARGDNPQLRAMAVRAVPMVEMHLARARALPVGM